MNPFYELLREIEASQSNKVRNMVIYVPCLDSNRLLISAEQMLSCGYDFKVFLIDCNISEDVVNTFPGNIYFEIVSVEGVLEEACMKNGIFDWVVYGLLLEIVSENEVEEEVLAMGVKLGVDPDKIIDSYIGKFANWISFVTCRFDELSLDRIPEEFRNYIDYEAIASDWEASGEYTYGDGYVFYQ